jgi:hypothetical protein
MTESLVRRLPLSCVTKFKSAIGMLTSVLVLCSLILATHVMQLPQAYSSDVTAVQVNGTWRSKTGTFKVWALGKQRLQVEFFGVYECKTSAGPLANTGEGSAIVFIEGDTATFKPEESDEDCKITMKFSEGKRIVEQEGGCGFGNNVTANGTCKKVSSEKPRFGEG